jgi:hypothetical protein
MKGISIVFALVSTSAFATSDIVVNVQDVGIFQAQDGYDLTQTAAIADVNKDFTGNTNIYVHNANIYQKQRGQGGKQAATIATICDCDVSKQ